MSRSGRITSLKIGGVEYGPVESFEYKVMAEGSVLRASITGTVATPIAMSGFYAVLNVHDETVFVRPVQTPAEECPWCGLSSVVPCDHLCTHPSHRDADL